MSSADAIESLSPECTPAERTAALATLIPLSPVDREHGFRKAAKKLDVSVATVKAEFKAIKDQADAEAAAKKLKEETPGEKAKICFPYASSHSPTVPTP